MRIRHKMPLLGLANTIGLLVGLIFSILSFTRFLAAEDFLIRVLSLESALTRVRTATYQFPLSMADDDALIEGLYQNYELMSEEMDSIEGDRYFKEISEDARNQFDALQQAFVSVRETFDRNNLSRILGLRFDAPGDMGGRSLDYIYISLRDSEETESDYFQQIESALSELELFISDMDRLELALNIVILRIDESTEIYLNRQILYATLLPLLIVLSVFIFSVFSAASLSRKLFRLDAALVDVAGGDFSTRIDIKGDTELESLSNSINAFTRTLGAKLESFRLMMHDMGESLGETVESSQVEQTIVRLALKDTVADGAALYRVGGEAGELVLETSEGRFHPPYKIENLPDDFDQDDLQALLRSRVLSPGRTVLGEAASKGESRLIRNVEFAYAIDWVRKPDHPLYISSIIILPLRVGTTVLGVLAVTSSRPGRYFTDLEYTNMQSFAELAAITLDNLYKYADVLEASQLNREIGIAEEIQQDLLPKRLPRIQGGDISYLSRSIKGLNGDYFDVYPLGNGKTMITICEVAGRGVPAGLVMVMIRTVLRLAASADKDAKTIMNQLNADMTRRIAIENYASVGILILDQKGQFTFSSAAHYPLQILRKSNGQYESIQTKGIPVGIDQNTEYHQQEGVLETGDLALFHTDGIPESRNRDGKIFGMEPFLDIIQSNQSFPPEEIIESLRTELEFFERGTTQKDDQTVIILKFEGEGAA